MLAPSSPSEIITIIKEACARRTPLAAQGMGTRLQLGQPVAHTPLDLSKLTGVIFYEPEELVISVKPATPLTELVDLLTENRQMLAFEPPLRNAIHGEERSGTIGGAAMINLSGPRRLKAGALRDHILGLSAISGEGVPFKAGGRVMKNVTGYDLPKGLTGSYGTLAIVTDLIFKVLPLPETEATLLFEKLDDHTAIALLCKAMGTTADVSGAAHLPALAARRLGLKENTTLLRLEGFAPSVASRLDRLANDLAAYGAATQIREEASRMLWASIRDGEAAKGREGDRLWRLSVAPASGPAIVAAVKQALDCEACYDWSGGLIFLSLAPGPEDCGAEIIRASIKAAGGGHATLIRAPEEMRRRIPVFEPQPPALATLSRRLKAMFDPINILNPGRMGE